MTVKIIEIKDDSGHDYKDPNIPSPVPITSGSKMTVTVTHEKGIYVSGEVTQIVGGDPSLLNANPINDDSDTQSTLIWNRVDIVSTSCSLTVEDRADSNDGTGMPLTSARYHLTPDIDRIPGRIIFPEVHKGDGKPPHYINQLKINPELWVVGFDPAQSPGPVMATGVINRFDPNNPPAYYPPLIAKSQHAGPLFVLHFEGFLPKDQHLTHILTVRVPRQTANGLKWVPLVGDIRIKFV
jgi:hypothetical protein